MKKKRPIHTARRSTHSTHRTCTEIAEHICNELDENIHSPACREIREHLKGCPKCRAYLDSMKKTIHFYQQYPCPTLPEQCREELFTSLKNKNMNTSRDRH